MLLEHKLQSGSVANPNKFSQDKTKSGYPIDGKIARVSDTTAQSEAPKALDGIKCDVTVIACGAPKRSMGWYHSKQLLAVGKYLSERLPEKSTVEEPPSKRPLERLTVGEALSKKPMERLTVGVLASRKKLGRLAVGEPASRKPPESWA